MRIPDFLKKILLSDTQRENFRILEAANIPIFLEEFEKTGVKETHGLGAFIEDLKKIPEKDMPKVGDVLKTLVSKGRSVWGGLIPVLGNNVELAEQAIKKWGDPQNLVDGLALYVQTQNGAKAAEDVQAAYKIYSEIAQSPHL